MVPRKCLLHLPVVHLHRDHLRPDPAWGKNHGDPRAHYTRLDAAACDGADPPDFIHFHDGDAEGLVSLAGRGAEGIQGLQQSAGLVPRHTRRPLNQAISDPGAHGHDIDHVGVVADLPEADTKLTPDMVEPVQGVLHGLVVHFVDPDHDLLNAEGVGEQDMFTCLPVFAEALLKLPLGRGDGKQCRIGLGRSRNHIFHEISATGGVNHGVLAEGGFEGPETDVNGVAAVTLILEPVKHPGKLTPRLGHVLRLLNSLLHPLRIDSPRSEDQVPSGS
mmetsp:Transcript_116211/g.266772  ORF Transcript_116211/g.266772 Transcript_116211/m.266772 type:complete len:275 (+) Transcript_116211:657-1481(+)